MNFLQGEKERKESRPTFLSSRRWASIPEAAEQGYDKSPLLVTSTATAEPSGMDVNIQLSVGQVCKQFGLFVTYAFRQASHGGSRRFWSTAKEECICVAC